MRSHGHSWHRAANLEYQPTPPSRPSWLFDQLAVGLCCQLCHALKGGRRQSRACGAGTVWPEIWKCTRTRQPEAIDHFMGRRRGLCILYERSWSIGDAAARPVSRVQWASFAEIAVAESSTIRQQSEYSKGCCSAAMSPSCYRIVQQISRSIQRLEIRDVTQDGSETSVTHSICEKRTQSTLKWDQAEVFGT